MRNVVASWSGGKDSCLACYKAIQRGFRVLYLINFVYRDRCAFHGLNPNLVAAQSQAIGVPLIQREVFWDTYEDVFKATLTELKKFGVEGMVFGDIHVRDHLGWVNRVCGEVGITPLEPLWGMNPEQVLREFMNVGFEAIVVNVKADLFGSEWLGRKIDENFLKELKELKGKRDFDMCGEYGEYHTLVIDGPLFKKGIKILESRKVLVNGYWKYWLLDILKWEFKERG
ncbi:MAG: diphthine--ammonia ligase [Candidatus Bathyarchaeia archaeon]|nr:diphthine--ammonia ligase [Candidatus Bathyarchaeota archaeon]